MVLVKCMQDGVFLNTVVYNRQFAGLITIQCSKLLLDLQMSRLMTNSASIQRWYNDLTLKRCCFNVVCTHIETTSFQRQVHCKEYQEYQIPQSRERRGFWSIQLLSNDIWSHLMTKPTKWHVSPAKTRISLNIRPVWPESSLSESSKLGSLATHWEHNEDSDQTRR